MAEFNRYRRKQIAELADWQPGFDMTGVSVSEADKAAGSPKQGDKIARNPANHADRWLVAADYFAANFESYAPAESVKMDALDARRYQWLKAHNVEHYDDSLPAICCHRLDESGWGKWHTFVYDEPDEMDAAIDKAMLAAAPERGEGGGK